MPIKTKENSDPQIISSADLGVSRRRNEIFRRILEENESFVVRGRNKLIARLIPLAETEVERKDNESDIRDESVNTAEPGQFIHPIDIKRRMSHILFYLGRGITFTILKKRKEIARMSPYSENDTKVARGNVITATALNRLVGHYINQARDGVHFVIEKHGNKVAVLGPPHTKMDE